MHVRIRHTGVLLHVETIYSRSGGHDTFALRFCVLRSGFNADVVRCERDGEVCVLFGSELNPSARMV
jgi:hypothetical protein